MDLAIPTTVLRAQQGQYNKGRWEHQEPEEVCMQAVIQSASPDDMQDLPEGRHMEETVKIYTFEELYSKEKQKQPDKIVWLNAVFEIHSVTNQSQYGGFYKSIGVKVVS
jgi:apolipoprotein N-acyltransferase